MLPDNYEPRVGDIVRCHDFDVLLRIVKVHENGSATFDDGTVSPPGWETIGTWSLRVRGALTLEEREALPKREVREKPTPESVRQLLRATWRELVKATKRMRELEARVADQQGTLMTFLAAYVRRAEMHTDEGTYWWHTDVKTASAIPRLVDLGVMEWTGETVGRYSVARFVENHPHFTPEAEPTSA